MVELQREISPRPVRFERAAVSRLQQRPETASPGLTVPLGVFARRAWLSSSKLSDAVALRVLPEKYHAPDALKWARITFLGLILVVAGGLGAYPFYRAGEDPAAGDGAGRPLAGPPGSTDVVNVMTAPAVMEANTEKVAALGTTRATRSATIVAQISGMVEEIAFIPGARVRSGDLLLRLEDDSQRVAVDKARIALREAQAGAARAEQLAQSQSISKVMHSTALAAAELAEVELKTALIELDRRHIKAPFDGVIGLTDVSIGDFIGSDTEIASLQDLTTLRVTFEVAERFASRTALGLAVTARAPGLPGAVFKGKVTGIDNHLDESTRTLRLEATVENEAGTLRPGMALSVSVDLGAEQQLIIPSLAVQWDREGSFVWKLEGDVAQRAKIAILSRESGFVAVEGDVHEGDIVVVEGVHRLREGAKVATVNTATIAPLTAGSLQALEPWPWRAASPGPEVKFVRSRPPGN